jgi:hypothetical protein
MLNFLFRCARTRTLKPAPASRRRSFFPRLEALEDRSLPSTLTVINLADSGVGSLRDRLAAAAAGDTVAFAPGLSGTVFLGSALDITQSLTVQGPGSAALTLYGQQATQVIHVEAGVTAGISGLTVAGGSDWQGGGIHNDGSLTLDRVTVRDNQAGDNFLSGLGGGIYNAPGASLTITRSTFSNNGAYISSSLQGGGGIYNGGALSVFATTFSGNSVSSGSLGSVRNGSAVYNDRPVSGVTPTATFDSCTFTANGHNSISSWGNLTLRRSTVSGDTIVGVECGGTATIDSCSVTGNGTGGGIEARGSLTLVNSTVAGNQGTGLTVRRGTSGTPTSIAIANCTIADNTNNAFSDVSGAGIDVVGMGTSTSITLHNTILAGNVVVPSGGTPILKDLNTSTTNTILATPPTYESLGYNLIQAPGSATITGTATGNLFGIDPLLGPLQDNGGPTKTMALLPGSPALNAGDPTQLGVADQRGVVRSGGVNIGAYQASASAFVVIAPQTVTAGAPFNLTVKAVDMFGQTASGYTGTVHFNSSDGPAVLPGNYTFTSSDAGLHTFTSGVTLKTAGNRTVTATDTVTSSITGSAAVMVNPAAADHLLFLQQPTDTAARQTMRPVIVAVVDAFGNVVTADNTDTVTLSLGINPAGGRLRGTLKVTVVNGIATFNNLTIGVAGAGYTLHATIGGALPNIDSNTFTITQ